MDKIKKLKLKKEVIASLSNVEMDEIKGGACACTCYCYLTQKDCVTTVHQTKTNAECVPPSVTCLPTDPYW